MTTMTSGKPAPTTVGPIDVSFEGVLERSPATGGWTYVIWPRSADVFGTRGLVKVSGVVDGVPFDGSFMALGDGRHKLAVTARVRQAIRKEVGDSVHVHLTERRS